MGSDRRSRQQPVRDRREDKTEERNSPTNHHKLSSHTSATHWKGNGEINLIGPELGRGGWATVSIAMFRGVHVAAKSIHRQIISLHNIQLFRREMNVAARIRHPNLVQFIGATSEGEMVILIELMPTSLR